MRGGPGTFANMLGELTHFVTQTELKRGLPRVADGITDPEGCLQGDQWRTGMVRTSSGCCQVPLHLSICITRAGMGLTGLQGGKCLLKWLHSNLLT